jgi:glucose-1-phosphate cytidylyltransferase
VICCGYKGYLIKEYFANYFLHMSDVTLHMKLNSMQVHHKYVEPWEITLVDTGESTMTGGRLKRVREYVGDSSFCFTYGDGVADVNIKALIAHHKAQGRLATVTAVQPPGRYGALQFADDNAVSGFQEKPDGDGGWINGGFFVLEPEAINSIDGDLTLWEQEPLKGLAHSGQLTAYRHTGFWQPMDTLRDRQLLEELWSKGEAPWKIWRE